MVWNKMKKTKREFSYFSYMKRYKWTSFLAPFLKSIETVCELFVPLIMAKINDYGIKNNDINFIFWNGVFAIIIVFFQRRDPKSVWAWLLLLYFVPVLGFVLYLLFRFHHSR